MLYVVFTRLDHSMIKKFEKIPLDEAVKLSSELETEMREQKKEIPGEFHLIDSEEDGEAVYSGTFNFGSYFAPNLFIHIKKKLPSIKTSKEKAQKRIELMEKMEETVDEEYKQEEDQEQSLLQRIDQTKISYFKRWQRRTIYGIGLFFAVAFVIVSAFFFINIASLNNDFKSLQVEKSNQEELITSYQNAVLGESESLKQRLAEKDTDELDTKEKQIYSKYLANGEQYEKLLKVHDGNATYVANFLSEYSSIEKLKSFNDYEPTNEATFDIAYAEEDFEEVTSVEDVEMTKDRTEKLTYAYLQTGEIKKAKEQLENISNEELANKVEEYEELNSQIADLNKKIEDAKDDKKGELKDKKQKLENQQKEI